MFRWPRVNVVGAVGATVAAHSAGRSEVTAGERHKTDDESEESETGDGASGRGGG